MTEQTDFRELCSELLQALDEIAEYEVVDLDWIKSKPLKMASESMRDARAALAAAPPPDWRELCEELVMSWDCDGCDWKPQHQDRWNATVDKARTTLAFRESPTIEEMKDG